MTSRNLQDGDELVAVFDGLVCRETCVAREARQFHGSSHEVAPVCVEDLVQQTEETRLEFGRRVLKINYGKLINSIQSPILTCKASYY